jgi:hypothetical protein
VKARTNGTKWDQIELGTPRFLSTKNWGGRIAELGRGVWLGGVLFLLCFGITFGCALRLLLDCVLDFVLDSASGIALGCVFGRCSCAQGSSTSGGGTCIVGVAR